MNFEEELKNKLRNEIIASLNDINCNFNAGNEISDKTKKQSFYDIDEKNAIIYILKKFPFVCLLGDDKLIRKAISTKNNNFKYHCHEFSLKKSSNEEIFVISNGIIVANILTNGEEYLVEVLDEKHVENFGGRIKPIIENGRLLNRSEFIEEKSISKDTR